MDHPRASKSAEEKFKIILRSQQLKTNPLQLAHMATTKYPDLKIIYQGVLMAKELPEIDIREILIDRLHRMALLPKKKKKRKEMGYVLQGSEIFSIRAINTFHLLFTHTQSLVSSVTRRRSGYDVR